MPYTKTDWVDNVTALGAGNMNKIERGLSDALELYKQYSSSPDASGVYLVVEYKRQDGTLYLLSTLSNPDTDLNYLTDTCQFFDAAGTTVVATQVYTLTYDVRGNVVSRV